MQAQGRGSAHQQRRGRGDWRPSRGFGNTHRGGQWRQQTSTLAETEDRAPSPPLGELMETIKMQDVNAETGEPKVSDCSFLASFNWLDGKHPTIIMPGMPPVWKPLSKPIRLEEDAGEYFRDPNAARFSEYPLEPAVRALLAQNLNLSTEGIDIFACGSTLGNLLRFVRDIDKPFRFTVEVVGRTAFFVRRENSPDEKIIGVRGYGHSFPDRYTRWETAVKGSASHQRLVSYTFAGLKCIVRFEGDGYLDDKLQQPLDERKPQPLPALESLTVKIGGRKIPQHAIFDLKTRSAKRKEDDILSGELPRLWIAQIPHLVLAFHERGVFNDIRVQNVQKEVRDWERENADFLRRLGAVIHEIVELVRASPDGKCEVRCRERGILEVRHQLRDAARPLCDSLRRIWACEETISDSEESDASGGAYASSQSGQHSDDGVDLATFSDEESEKDYTACSEDCGYCGRCVY